MKSNKIGGADAADVAEAISDAADIIDDVDEEREALNRDFCQKTGKECPEKSNGKFRAKIILSVSILILITAGISGFLPNKAATT